MSRQLQLLVCALAVILSSASAQSTAAASNDKDSELRFVVYLSRHGIRSPTGKAAQYNTYSSAPWPEWEVVPGHLTTHGFRLMEMFGAYDRMELASEGLFDATGCKEASGVTVYADSDHRTRETGKALAQGMFPGCSVSVIFLPEGTNDPLFHALPANAGNLKPALAKAAIAGRIGDHPEELTQAYRAQLTVLDTLLASCGASSQKSQKRISLFDIPSTLSTGAGDHLADLKGPLTVASTLSENLLLEYTEGLDTVGWGCVDGARVRSLIDLHTAATDFTQRTKVVARVQASNLLDQIRKTLDQAVTHSPVAGAVGKASDRALFLVGHDTNLENISGLLNLTWVADGRKDDTPPGSALIFELWKKRNGDAYTVRTYYTAQTLEEMRQSLPLSLSNPPVRVPIFIPGCSGEDFACTLPNFMNVLREAIDPNNVVTTK